MTDEQQSTGVQNTVLAPLKASRARLWVAVLAALVGAAFAAGGVVAYQHGWLGFGRVRVQTVAIAASVFRMGSSDGERDEGPEHQVSVKAFRIDRTEVTVADYQVCVTAGNCTAAFTNFMDCNFGKPGKGKHPINCVNYAMAETYCKWRGARLPNEAEWEFAARGKEGRVYPWGGEPPINRACYLRKRENLQSCDVGSFPSDSSPSGVMDLGGNVAEWTHSNYCNYANPMQCKPGTHVVRGGSWDMESPLYVRSSYRDWVADERYGYNLGFRCATDG